MRKAQRNTSYGTSFTEKSPARKKRDAAARRRQEKRWARKSGPVSSRFECPVCGGDHARADCPGPT